MNYSAFKKVAVSVFIFINYSCTSVIYKNIIPSSNDKKYDSEFPYNDGSEQLEGISNTIYRVNSLAFYKAYIFDENSKIKLKDLNDDVIKNQSIKTTYLDKASSGTSTLIYSSNGTVALLTCAHVIDFPDTIVSYFSEKQGTFSDNVQSIAFMSRRFIYVAGFPEGSEVKEILSDKSLDITIIGNNYNSKFERLFHVFNYPFGKAKDLSWGNFVYVFGFPLNYKMISSAIVSSPNYDRTGSFFIDAVVNRGYSGGLVLAVKNGIPNFELVGIIEWVPEENENILEPAPVEESIKYNPLVPYKGDMFVKQQKLLRYGITKVIPMESIVDFLMKNKEFFIKNGYYFNIYKN